MPNSDLESLFNSRNVRRVRPKPYGDRPPTEAVNGTAEVCGKCHGRIEPDEPICMRTWATWWNPPSRWNGHQGSYIEGSGPWCLDCAGDCAVPLVDVGRTVWPDRCSPY